MVKPRFPRSGRTRRSGSLPQQPRFRQRELWDSLEAPVEVAEAIRALAALRERLEQALAVDRSRAGARLHPAAP